MLNFENFLFEADNRFGVHTFSEVANEPVNYQKSGVKKPITRDRIKEIIATYGKNIQKKAGEQDAGSKIDLTKDNTDFQIKAKDGELYKLQFIQLMLGKDKKKYCAYSIKTDDEEINNQLVNYTLLDDNVYNNVVELYDYLINWRKSLESKRPVKMVSNQNNNVRLKPEPILAGFTSNYSLFSKLFEDVNQQQQQQHQQQPKMTVDSFDNSALYNFGSAAFRSYQNYDFVKKCLELLKTNNPDLYSKTFKEFNEMKTKNLIIKVSEKMKFATKWFIQRKSEETKNFYRIVAGDSIKNNDIIRFEANGKKYSTSEIQIVSLLK